jgi:hypothetical protein
MDFYQQGTEKLILEYEKCVSFRKDCVEKRWDDSSIAHNFSLYALQTYILTNPHTAHKLADRVLAPGTSHALVTAAHVKQLRSTKTYTLIYRSSLPVAPQYVCSQRLVFFHDSALTQ